MTRDDRIIIEEPIKVETPDGVFQAYVARPKAEPRAAIVVIQEIFGVNSDLRETCNELAANGYVAVSPDLFWRLQPGVDMSDRTDEEWKAGMALYAAFDCEAGASDIAATMRTVRGIYGAPKKVGLIGFCLGGLMTFITSARHRPDAAVAYYGGGTETHLNEVKTLSTPLMIHLAEDDEYIPELAQNKIKAAVQDLPNVEIYSYPACHHAFARHRGAHYDASAAKLAARRTAEFFRVHLA